MQIEQGTKIGAYVLVTDSSGIRVAIRRGSVPAIWDKDETQDECVLFLAGRTFVIPASMDEVLAWLS